MHTMGAVAQPTPGTKAATFAAEALAHVSSLHRTAMRLTAQPSDADDLVQDTYLRAFRSASQFTPGTNLRAWLFTILHNAARNRARDRGRAIVVADSEVVDRAAEQLVAATAAPVATPEDLLLAREAGGDVREALQTLPEAFREAVWLRDVEEFSYAEIADMLQVPQGTVMSRISRGRRLLHARLTAMRAPHA